MLFIDRTRLPPVRTSPSSGVPSVNTFVRLFSGRRSFHGVPSQPGGVPSQPGGVPSLPGSVPSLPRGVPSQPGGILSQPGGVTSQHGAIVAAGHLNNMQTETTHK